MTCGCWCRPHARSPERATERPRSRLATRAHRISEIRSRTRTLTQTIGRHLYDEGYAGVAFSSNIDGRPCFALFEGRAELQQFGEPLPMTNDLPVLSAVCAQLGLRLLAT